MNAATRLRRSRAKGARLPDGAVCVDRSTPYGNPLVVGKYGTAAECVEGYSLMCGGLWPVAWVSRADFERVRDQAASRFPDLRGKALACYCGLDKPCHANVQLPIANAPEGQPVTSTMMDWKLPGLANIDQVQG